MAVASAGTVIVVGGGGLDDGGVVEVEPEGAVAGFAAAEGGGADGAVEVDEGAPGGAGSCELQEPGDTALILPCRGRFVN